LVDLLVHVKIDKLCRTVW